MPDRHRPEGDHHPSTSTAPGTTSAHNPKVAGSNPAPATNENPGKRPFSRDSEGAVPPFSAILLPGFLPDRLGQPTTARDATPRSDLRVSAVTSDREARSVPTSSLPSARSKARLALASRPVHCARSLSARDRRRPSAGWARAACSRGPTVRGNAPVPTNEAGASEVAQQQRRKRLSGATAEPSVSARPVALARAIRWSTFGFGGVRVVVQRQYTPLTPRVRPSWLRRRPF